MPKPIEIDVRDFCPALQNPKNVVRTGTYEVSLDPERDETSQEVFCESGGKWPYVEITGDRYIQTIGSVEITCEGCNLLPLGFKKTVRRKIS